MISAEQKSIDDPLHDRRMPTANTGYAGRTGVPPAPFIIAGASS